MLKRFLMNGLIGGSIWVIGACLHDFGGMHELGNFMASIGIVFIVATTLMVIFGNDPLLALSNIFDNKATTKAQDQLLKYKGLLDAGIITQEEYDKKATELKKVIL